MRRFIELTAHQLGWGQMQWDGDGTSEVGRRGDTGVVVVRIDPRYFRPAEVETLLGDPTNAKEKLDWTPKTTLEELVAEMVATDVEEGRKRPTSAQGLCCRVHGMSLITTSDVLRYSAPGMAGSAISRALDHAGYNQQLKPSQELDLLDSLAVQAKLVEHQPTVVVLAAAKVVYSANSSYPADFLLENLKIQTNVIETAWRSGVRRLLFLGSSCIPKVRRSTIKEEALLTGSLEPTNEWYALAKIAGIKFCESLRQQYGFDAISLMPTNLYGPGDNYHITNSHVLPALIRRFHEAAEANVPTVTCWGTGSPMREFLHVHDLGDATVHALEMWKPDADELPFINVGTGTEISIFELAMKIASACNYCGKIEWDHSKPDGTPRKLLDVERMRALGWSFRVLLPEGIRDTVASYRKEILTQQLRL